jgi:hypothetical protein
MNERAQASRSVSPRRADDWAGRAQWLMLGLLAFISFESLLLAAVFKGPWLVLIAPGIVCGMRACEAWKELRPLTALTSPMGGPAAPAAGAPGHRARGTLAPSMPS